MRTHISLPILSFLLLSACSHADHATSPAEMGVATPEQPAIIDEGPVAGTKAPVEVPVPSAAVPRATDAGSAHEGGELTVE